MSRGTKDKEPPHPDDWGARTFETTGFSAYRLSVPTAHLTFDIGRLRRERDELIGELTVRVEMAGARTIDGILSSGDFNLSSIQARSTRAKHLAGRASADDIDWEGLLHELCLKVVAAERTGAPAVLLGDIEPSTEDAEFDLCGWTLPQRQPAILFGDGGSGKSLLSLWAAGELARAGQLVMYVDWESDGSDHRSRLDLLYPRGLPAILYTRCERALVVEIDRLRALTLEHGITYCVLDSAAFGCQGAPEAAESAIGYFRALRTLNVGSLVIAHVTKSEDGDKRPFGSSFWHNSARSTWHAKRSNPDDDGPEINVLLSQRKCNRGRLRSPLALSIQFGPTQTTITRTSVSNSPEFATSLTVLQRVRSAVSGNAVTLESLRGEWEDIKPNSVTQAVKRGVEKGFLVKFEREGVDYVGLKAK